jgi:hypothetical protein
LAAVDLNLKIYRAAYVSCKGGCRSAATAALSCLLLLQLQQVHLIAGAAVAGSVCAEKQMLVSRSRRVWMVAAAGSCVLAG